MSNIAHEIWSHTPRMLLAAAACAYLAGCAPSTILDNPPGWPEQWAGRKLYNTPNAYVYAADDAGAGELDRLAAGAAGDFRTQTKGSITKGLLIALDAGMPMDEHAKRLMRISMNHEAVRKGKPPLTDADFAKAMAVFDQAKAKAGVNIMTFVLLNPIALEKSDLCDEFALPSAVAEGASWAVVVPTRAFIRQAVDGILQTPKMSLGERVLVAPLLAALLPAMIDGMASMRGVAVFERLAMAQDGWTEQRKKSEIASYAARKGAQAAGRITAGLPRDVKARMAAATMQASRPGRPVDSRPTTATTQASQS